MLLPLIQNFLNPIIYVVNNRMNSNQTNFLAILPALQNFQQNQNSNAQNPQLLNFNFNFQLLQFSSQFGGSDSTYNLTLSTTLVQSNTKFPNKGL